MLIPRKEDLVKISDYIWEIPRSFRSDMKVPARILASERMIDDLTKDKSLWQLINLTTLPGIYKYSLSMPDIHEGYGSPVGGVAAFLKEEGIISPGICGYDINCLHPESNILTVFGCYLPIKDLDRRLVLLLINKKNKKMKKAEIKLMLKRYENSHLYLIRTKLGYEIKLTYDHPLYTPRGMIEAKSLQRGQKVIIYPFKGIKYDRPESHLLFDRESVISTLKKLKIYKEEDIERIVNWLERENFIPLHLDDPKVPYLLKILGYATKNGRIFYSEKLQKLQFFLHGEYEDLLLIQEDLKKIGINSLICGGKEKNKIKNNNHQVKRIRSEKKCLKVSNDAFSLLIHLLGISIGKNIESEIHVPYFIRKSPLWYKRLYLASILGTKLLDLKVSSQEFLNFYTPTLSIRKISDLQENAYNFMKDIKSLLLEFGVKTTKIKIHSDSNSNKKIVDLRMTIEVDPENLLKFFETIGFEYGLKKQKLACLTSAYIRYRKIVGKRIFARVKIEEFFEKILNIRGLINIYGKVYPESHSIKNSTLLEEKPLMTDLGILSFDEFLSQYAFGEDGFIVDEITEIEKVNYKGFVYDLTINDEDHNFISNNFVVSNCGVRLLVSPFFYEEIKEKISKLTEQIFKEVPSGVGKGGFWNLNNTELNKVLSEGAKWLYEMGYAYKDDLEATESYGKLEGADPDKVSKIAKERGRDQLGTIGAGNHFIEIQRVSEVFNEKIAHKLGLEKNKICVLIHCGSRGLGHQVATDYIKEALRYLDKRNIYLVDRELAYFPFDSDKGKNYFSAMKASANFAFANRQFITYEIRKAFRKVFGNNVELKQVYDVAHNIVKEEIYDNRKLLVHRKGATRSFPLGSDELPHKYREIGQPTLIPGSMGTSSYVLIGQPPAMEISFGSSPHGAGRAMSRTEARKKIRGNQLKRELEERGIAVAAGSITGLAEEAPAAYKDVSEVVEIVDKIGISKKIAKLIPIGIIKG